MSLITDVAAVLDERGLPFTLYGFTPRRSWKLAVLLDELPDEATAVPLPGSLHVTADPHEPDPGPDRADPAWLRWELRDAYDHPVDRCAGYLPTAGGPRPVADFLAGYPAAYARDLREADTLAWNCAYRLVLAALQKRGVEATIGVDEDHRARLSTELTDGTTLHMGCPTWLPEHPADLVGWQVRHHDLDGTLITIAVDTLQPHWPEASSPAALAAALASYTTSYLARIHPHGPGPGDAR